MPRKPGRTPVVGTGGVVPGATMFNELLSTWLG